MSKFNKGVVLYHKDGKVAPYKPGTAAEFHQLLLQGWSTSKPGSAPTPPSASTSKKKD